jgi:hypothetical protein
MNWKKSVLELKAFTGVSTDKGLYLPAKVSPNAFASIKRGTASFENIEKLCYQWGVKPSQFIKWGEQC